MEFPYDPPEDFVLSPSERSADAAEHAAEERARWAKFHADLPRRDGFAIASDPSTPADPF
jgi:hypothetical protein